MEQAGSFQLSYWEKSTHFGSCDVLIIGGGLVGLFSALELKQKDPGLRITVLDRGPFLPYGASTRNAGFACFGSISELLDDLQSLSEEQVFSLVERRYKGLLKMRSLLGDEAIDYEPLGGYEVFTNEQYELSEKCFASLESFNTAIKPITGLDQTYVDASHEMASFGLGGVTGIIRNQGEGQIDTGKMMKRLLQKVRESGTDVFTGLGVVKLDEHASHINVHTNFGFVITAGRVLVTTNAFACELLPELDVRPGRAQVLVTDLIPGLRLRGSFHYDRGYYYFRNVGERVMFGGGRHLDFEGERTTDFGLTEKIQDSLEELLRTMILPGTEFRIEQRWSGIMGLGPDRMPVVKSVSPRVFCAVRMGGMGVAIGSVVAEEAAEMVVG